MGNQGGKVGEREDLSSADCKYLMI